MEIRLELATYRDLAALAEIEGARGVRGCASS
jgi:hypothetical protein